jgi:hypothetical protein
MEAIKNATSASILTRFLANVFIFMLMVAAMVVAAVQIIQGHDVSPIIMTVLGTGTGYALHVVGINQGVTLQPLNKDKVIDA